MMAPIAEEQKEIEAKMAREKNRVARWLMILERMVREA
jgi:hypothetical protein